MRLGSRFQFSDFLVGAAKRTGTSRPDDRPWQGNVGKS